MPRVVARSGLLAEIIWLRWRRMPGIRLCNSVELDEFGAVGADPCLGWSLSWLVPVLVGPCLGWSLSWLVPVLVCPCLGSRRFNGPAMALGLASARRPQQALVSGIPKADVAGRALPGQGSVSRVGQESGVQAITIDDGIVAAIDSIEGAFNSRRSTSIDSTKAGGRKQAACFGGESCRQQSLVFHRDRNRPR
ncbi:hypothetical protein SV7mr_21940 [Stieleria bergensis]|uniref:Uncharacterized protein n=1 Tax=Stieleria bergensis TaxID=2528025 RepID=A0A517SU71_9BACT|nr:hypothetical protein SV7mr_21940 [Planctomycetes bacterium SV_7m_r]